jgi:hypothetical protein
VIRDRKERRTINRTREEEEKNVGKGGNRRKRAIETRHNKQIQRERRTKG